VHRVSCWRALSALSCAAALWLAALGAHAEPIEQASAAQPVTVYGLSRTRLDTVLDLLPREPPAQYTDGELAELERRLANLGIFDLVRVTRAAHEIQVQLREKWTLIPMFDLSTGSTWRDTYVALAATEYNFLGYALLLTAAAWHEARGWNGSIGLNDHGYHPGRGSFGGMIEYSTAEYWYEESGDAWSVLGPGVLLQWQAPLPHGRWFNYQLGLGYRYEHNLDPLGTAKPPNGNQFNMELTVMWETLRWSDFAPRGITARLKLLPGVFIGSHAAAPRMAAEAYVVAGYAFSDVFVLLAQFTGTFMNRGNANFSYLLGSIGGVRGFQDAIYHTWAAALLNVELRYALRFAERWALQGVVFGDVAAFDRVDSRGRDAPAGWGASSGVGLRLIPSFLADVVLRIDAGRALWPEPSYFWQWGLSQYF
jgi:outer membrane protein assembly factor BamA